MKPREFKYALPHGVRHSYRPYIREISTPDWAATAPSSPAAFASGDFDVRDAHGQLEACEHRIISGVDQARRHPALCIDAASLRPELTLGESERAERYAVCEISEKVPAFWPARMWDQPAGRLSDVDSKRLGELLHGQEPEVLPKVAKSSVKIGPSLSPHRVKKTSLLLLDMNDYRTDASDEETDWDEL
jgi:hypothetical protein